MELPLCNITYTLAELLRTQHSVIIVVVRLNVRHAFPTSRAIKTESGLMFLYCTIFTICDSLI